MIEVNDIVTVKSFNGDHGNFFVAKVKNYEASAMFNDRWQEQKLELIRLRKHPFASGKYGLTKSRMTISAVKAGMYDVRKIGEVKPTLTELDISWCDNDLD